MFDVRVDADLALCLLRAGDAEGLFRLVSDNRDHLREWLPWLDLVNSVSDTRGFIARATGQFDEGLALHAGIWWRDTLTGAIAFNEINRSRSRVRIGYWLAAPFQGYGVVTRACRAMTDHALGPLGMKQVQIACASGNARSQSVPLRLGFRETGYERRAEWLYDHYVDHVVFGMSADAWCRTRR